MFVLAGLLPNLPCADLAFQQNSNKLCRFREQTVYEPPGSETEHIKCPLKTRHEIFYCTKQEHGERGAENEKPILQLRPQERRRQYISHHYITHMSFFFPLKRCSRALLIWCKMHNFSPPHRKFSYLKHCSF